MGNLSVHLSFENTFCIIASMGVHNFNLCDILQVLVMTFSFYIFLCGFLIISMCHIILTSCFDSVRPAAVVFAAVKERAVYDWLPWPDW